MSTSTSFSAGGTGVLTVSFTDENGDSVVPNEVSWSLYQAGQVVNSRNDVSISPAAEVDIVLQGADLVEGSSYVVVTGTYNSTLGSNLPFKEWTKINVKYVPEV